MLPQDLTSTGDEEFLNLKLAQIWAIANNLFSDFFLSYFKII